MINIDKTNINGVLNISKTPIDRAFMNRVLVHEEQIVYSPVIFQYKLIDGSSSTVGFNTLDELKTFISNIKLDLIECSIKANESGLGSIGTIFNSCENLVKVNSIEVNLDAMSHCSFTFYKCKKLSQLPDLNTSLIVYSSYMFQDCSSLKEIFYTNFENLVVATGMFLGSGITNININKSNKLVYTNNMFNACLSLVEIGLFNTSKAVNLDNMFTNCKMLIEIPKFDLSSAQYMNSMFSNCTTMTNFPITSTPKAKSMVAMFSNCNNLKDESLNNILLMCVSATEIPTKTLKYIDLPVSLIEKCTTLSNYQAFLDAGWTTGI